LRQSFHLKQTNNKQTNNATNQTSQPTNLIINLKVFIREGVEEYKERVQAGECSGNVRTSWMKMEK
jgi:hypothetical protein